MSTVYTCGGCGREMERYDDDGPYIERPKCLCPNCFDKADAFDRAFAAWEDNLGLDES